MALSLAQEVQQGTNEDANYALSALTAIHEIGSYLTSISDWSLLAAGIGHEIRRVINCDLFTLFLYCEEENRLEPRYSIRHGQEWPDAMSLQADEGICGAAAQLRRSVRVDDVTRDMRFIDCDRSNGIRSELAIPLIHSNHLVGVLNLESEYLAGFSKDDEWFMNAVAPLIANAVVNARLVFQLQKRERSMQDDLQAARAAQQGLLPRFAEHRQLMARWSSDPARELGGDFIESLPHPSDGVVHALGDVSGKGTAAALYGAMAQGMLRSEFLKRPTCPADVMHELNRELFRCLPANRFVALSLLCFDAQTNRLRYVNAGMPWPIIVREGKTIQLTKSSVPLGLLPDSQYTSINVDLEANDILILMSDGISETIDTNAVIRELLRRRHKPTLDSYYDAFTNANINNDPDFDDRTLIIWQVGDKRAELQANKTHLSQPVVPRPIAPSNRILPKLVKA